MKTSALFKPDLDERSYGSGYDPVLNGVAHGLARLFPPVGPVRTDRPVHGPADGHGPAHPAPVATAGPGTGQG